MFKIFVYGPKFRQLEFSFKYFKFALVHCLNKMPDTYFIYALDQHCAFYLGGESVEHLYYRKVFVSGKMCLYSK